MGRNIALAIGVLLASALLVYLIFAFIRYDWRWYADAKASWLRIVAAVSWLVVAGALRKMLAVVNER